MTETSKSWSGFGDIRSLMHCWWGCKKMHLWEFPLRLSSLRTGMVTAANWVVAVAWAGSLAWELPHARSAAKKKKKKVQMLC